MLPEVCHGLRSLDEVRAADWLSRLQGTVGWERLPLVERLAPAELELAGGRRYRLEYRPDGPPILAVRIQELFGTLQTPRVADGRVTVLVHLLGPNHRPQQVTSDLESFWRTTYHEVRKELRRRYPKGRRLGGRLALRGELGHPKGRHLLDVDLAGHLRSGERPPARLQLLLQAGRRRHRRRLPREALEPKCACALHIHLASELGGLELLAKCIAFLLELGEPRLARSGGHRKLYGRRCRHGGLSLQQSQLSDLSLQRLDVANV